VPSKPKVLLSPFRFRHFFLFHCTKERIQGTFLKKEPRAKPTIPATASLMKCRRVLLEFPAVTFFNNRSKLSINYDFVKNSPKVHNRHWPLRVNGRLKLALHRELLYGNEFLMRFRCILKSDRGKMFIILFKALSFSRHNVYPIPPSL